MWLLVNSLPIHPDNLLDEFQSGFRPKHSTETALTKVTNNLLIAMDSDVSSVLLLLDLSAAFDTVDHDTLLQCLENPVGLKGLALSWFRYM